MSHFRLSCAISSLCHLERKWRRLVQALDSEGLASLPPRLLATPSVFPFPLRKSMEGETLDGCPKDLVAP